jgi:hypothetical protein
MGQETVVYRAESTDERLVGQMGCCSAWKGVLMAVTVTAMLVAAKVNKLAD